MWQKSGRYTYLICDTLEKLKLADEYMHDAEVDFLAYDTETNGLHIKRNVIIGFSFSKDATSGFYVPLLTWERDESVSKTKTIDKVKYLVYPEGKLKDVWRDDTYYDEFVTPDDIKTVAPYVLRHRVNLNADLEIEGYPIDKVVDDILQEVEAPRI